MSLSQKAPASVGIRGPRFSPSLSLIMKLLEEGTGSLSNIICHYQMCGFSREKPVIGQVLPTRTNGSPPYCIIIGAEEDAACAILRAGGKANKQGQGVTHILPDEIFGSQMSLSGL